MLLTFALIAPMASFGGIAVGEERGTGTRPGRSAILGLVGACLGLDREDDDAQLALATGYDVGVLCESTGHLLIDYHTVQTASSTRKTAPRTRAEELRSPDLNTTLSQRSYRTDTWFIGAIAARDGSRWTLEELGSAMTSPAFAPYLGRKSCPLGLPLAPQVTASTDMVEALIARRRGGPETGYLATHLPTTTKGKDDGMRMVAMDADQVTDRSRASHRRTEARRDQPRSRTRWQFDMREEAILSVAVS